jgi:hypothetical protein
MTYHLQTKIAALLVVVLLPALAAAQKLDSFAGTWTLNQDKSTFEPLANRPDRRTVTFAIKGDELTHNTETRRTVRIEVEPFEEAATTKTSYTAKFDGRDYKVPNSTATVKLRKVNARTFERVATNGTKGMKTSTWALSPDGKTLTVTTKGTDEYGMIYSSTQVYDRQP